MSLIHRMLNMVGLRFAKFRLNWAGLASFILATHVMQMFVFKCFASILIFVFYSSHGGGRDESNVYNQLKLMIKLELELRLILGAKTYSNQRQL